jgi:hypothetical protein
MISRGGWVDGNRRHPAEELVAKLRLINVLMEQGRQVPTYPGDRCDKGNLQSVAQGVGYRSAAGSVGHWTN